MDTDTFWQIIDQARRVSSNPGDADEIALQTSAVLATQTTEEIIEFAVVFERLQDVSYRWDLWAAAYLINGGCSDDGFDYFRGWLVAQGQKVWDAALADPDSLADVAPGPESDPELMANAQDMLAAAMVHRGQPKRRTGHPAGP